MAGRFAWWVALRVEMAAGSGCFELAFFTPAHSTASLHGFNSRLGGTLAAVMQCGGMLRLDPDRLDAKPVPYRKPGLGKLTTEQTH
jgi:hypothetical protein